MGRARKKPIRPPVSPATQPSPRRPSALVASLGLTLLVAVLASLLLVRRVPPNLLLVTIDTLRADRVGAYGYAGAATPTLDRLASGGALFEEVQAAVPITAPSHATIFTGRYPPVHRVRDNVAFTLDERHPTLATLLKRQGYRTAAFVGAFPVASAFGFGQGFDRFSEEIHPTPEGGQGAERPANEVADAALAWFAEGGPDPFFAWVHFYDPHEPYTPPPEMAERFVGRPYDGEIAFVDVQLERILRHLEDSDRDESTLVVALSDHGEGLGDHGEASHAVLAYQSTLRVPLILAGPGVPPGRVVPQRVGLVDVLPTILGLLGVESPQGLPGRDLRPALRGEGPPARPLYAESLFGRLNCRWSSLRSLVQDDWKLIVGAEAELYDLGEDPGELRNLAAQDPDRVARMRDALSAELRRMAPEGDSARRGALSLEQEGRLRSLGYLSGSGGSGVLDAPGLPDPRTHVDIYATLQRASVARGRALQPALEELVGVVERDPGNPFAHFTFASLAYREGSFRLAAAEFARTIELDPEWPAMRRSYGRLLREMGRLEDSEQQLRIAVSQTAADDHGVRVSLAETLIGLGRLGEASALIEAVLDEEPRHVEALGAKAEILASRGRTAEAVAHFQRAAQGRASPDPWIRLALAYLSLADPEKAQQAVSEALRRNPGHPWALTVSGHALVLQGRRDEGLDLLRRALTVPPRRHDAWMDLARAFEAAGDRAAASTCRRRAATLAAR